MSGNIWLHAVLAGPESDLASDQIVSDRIGSDRIGSDRIRANGCVLPRRAVINSRGNCYASLGRWEDALVDYEACSGFQGSRVPGFKGSRVPGFQGWG